MAKGAIPLGKNDLVKVNSSDKAGFLVDKLKSSDGSVDITVSSCGCDLDLAVVGVGGIPENWTKYTIDFDDAGLQTGTNSAVFSIATGVATGTAIISTKKKQSTLFSGGSISAVDFQIGYNLDWDTASDINYSPIAPRGQTESPFYDSVCIGVIDVKFAFTGGVDTDLTQGSVDFWIKTIVLT